eukprot:5686476-Pyramimonas_sp.AAC.1
MSAHALGKYGCTSRMHFHPMGGCHLPKLVRRTEDQAFDAADKICTLGSKATHHYTGRGAALHRPHPDVVKAHRDSHELYLALVVGGGKILARIREASGGPREAPNTSKHPKSRPFTEEHQPM